MTSNVEQGHLDLAWGRCRYVTAGTGPTIVLVHGWSYSVNTWDEVIPPLVAAGYGVVAYDIRGHGESSPIHDHHTMAELVADLHEVIVALGVTSPLLCGHSLGGMIVAEYALAHPSEVAALALVDTGMAARPADLELDTMLADYLRTSTDTAYWWPILEPMLYSERFRAVDATRLALARDRFLAADLRSLHTVFRALAERDDLRPRLPQLAVPTVVVVGEQDPLWTVSDHTRVAESLPDARIVVLPEAGHLTPEETPAELAAALVTFVHAVRDRNTADA